MAHLFVIFELKTVFQRTRHSAAAKFSIHQWLSLPLLDALDTFMSCTLADLGRGQTCWKLLW